MLSHYSRCPPHIHLPTYLKPELSEFVTRRRV